MRRKTPVFMHGECQLLKRPVHVEQNAQLDYCVAQATNSPALELQGHALDWQSEDGIGNGAEPTLRASKRKRLETLRMGMETLSKDKQ